MPITQSRMIALIRAGRTWEAAWRDQGALMAAAVARHRRGELTNEQLYLELLTAHAVTEIPAAHQIVLVTEEQHFMRNEKKNNWSKVNSANKRVAGVLTRDGPTPEARRFKYASRVQREAIVIPAITQKAAERALSTAPAFAPGVNPLLGFAGEMPPNPYKPEGAPTPEQLAEDDAMVANMDPEELAKHKAALSKGDR